MSLTSTKSLKRYAPTTSTTVFPYDFKINANTELEVWRTTGAGVSSLLTLTTDYTVSGVGVTGGGNVTLLTGIADGKLTIKRTVALTQGVDLIANGPWLPEVIETALDSLTMANQQITRELARCPKVGVAADTDTDVPTPDEVEAWKTASEEAVTAAESAQASAETAQGLAESAMATATEKMMGAELAQDASEAARDISVGAAETTASNKADAQMAQGQAEDAKNLAVSAQGAAEDARDAAEAAQTVAESNLVTVWGGITTTAIPTELLVVDTGSRYALPSTNAGSIFTISLLGIHQGGSVIVIRKWSGYMYQIGGGTPYGSITIELTLGSGPGALDATLVRVGNSLLMTVTGSTGLSITWHAVGVMTKLSV